MMRDFALDNGFLQSCIDLPVKIRARIVSKLQAFAKDPRDRDLGVARVEGSKSILSLPVSDGYRIYLGREKPVITLLFVDRNDSAATHGLSKRGLSPDHMVMASVEALETLLVEEKYLLLARHLVRVPAATRELQFQIAEIEKILNAHLPPEARRFPNWWANQKSGKRAHAFAWMAAGWLVARIDIKFALVKFVRR